MTTIPPHGLAKAMDNHESFELLDVRSRQEFERAHIRGARSVPLRTLCPAQILSERGRRNPAPLFLICGQRAGASLAAGLLGGAGCLHPVVVEGGMQLWQTQGLPVIHPLRRQVVALAEPLGHVIRRHTLPLRSVWRDVAQTMQRALSRRHHNNAWWCRSEFQTREVYRG